MTAAPDLNAMVRDVLDQVRYVALGTIDDDGRPRVSPVYFTPHRYTDRPVLGVAPRDPPLDQPRSRQPGDGRRRRLLCGARQHPCVCVAGRAREIAAEDLAEHCPVAFDPGRGGRSFAPEELTGTADLRLWALHVDSWEVHIGAGHPTLGTGRDQGVPATLADTRRGASRPSDDDHSESTTECPASPGR